MDSTEIPRQNKFAIIFAKLGENFDRILFSLAFVLPF